MNITIPFQHNDGGRAAAGYKGHTGDCVCRAIAIVTERPYQEIYDLINAYGAKERTGKRKRGKSSARTGVYKDTIYKIMVEHFGFKWIPTMFIGKGCQVHVRPDELPATGRILLNLSRHTTAYIDGVLHDLGSAEWIHRFGTRCVYGYYIKPSNH